MSQPVASIDRPLALRLRPDLVAVPVEMSGERTWVIKDPVTLEHFQFTAEEYALLDWLRQRVSIAELRRRFAAEFAPQTISPQAVWSFLSRLHGAGLLIGDGPGQGDGAAREDAPRPRSPVVDVVERNTVDPFSRSRSGRLSHRGSRAHALVVLARWRCRRSRLW